MNYTQDDINSIVAEARAAAVLAADEFYTQILAGRDGGSCGFAWVDILGVKGSTRLGRMLNTAGVRKNSWDRTFQMWNPSGHPVQNVDTKEAGAEAVAQVFRRHGFQAQAGSRLD